MRIAIPLVSALFLTLCLVSVAEAQLPTARIVTRGASPEMVKTGPWSSVSSGLSNVGLGTKVWLEAKAVRGSGVSPLHFDTITAVTWRVISKPAGSSTSVVNIDTATGLMGLIAVMLPDSQGVYDVGLTVTTANG